MAFFRAWLLFCDHRVLSLATRLRRTAAVLWSRRRNKTRRRLNACVQNLWTKGPNKNRVILAFSVERNSVIDSGGFAERDRVRLLADRTSFFVSWQPAGR